MATTIRKRRSDRNQVIYKLTCTATGDTYIGITAADGRAYLRSVLKRWQKHIYHANEANRNGLLQLAIRNHGPEAFDHEVIEVVRGRSEAHKREKSLIRDMRPTLNIECTTRKKVGTRRRRDPPS
jgi:hypothetical protein